MRAKVCKVLRKMAYGEGSLKEPRRYEGGWKKFKIKTDDGIKKGRIWQSLTNTGPRAIYRKLKRHYRDHGKVI